MFPAPRDSSESPLPSLHPPPTQESRTSPLYLNEKGTSRHPSVSPKTPSLPAPLYTDVVEGLRDWSGEESEVRLRPPGDHTSLARVPEQRKSPETTPLGFWGLHMCVHRRKHRT